MMKLLLLSFTFVLSLTSVRLGAQSTQTVSVPQEKYAAYIVADPGAALTLKIVPDGVTACEIVDSEIVTEDTSDTVQWSRTTATPSLHQYDIGTVLSSREWVSINGEYKPCGGGGGGGTPDFDVDVLGVDIDVETAAIDSVAEANEESVGGFVCLNDDDDNKNETPDKDDTGTVDDENDLLKITIRKVEPSTRFAGQVTLSASAGSNRIKIWTSTNKVTQVSLPATFASPGGLPTNLWVEGVSTSDSKRDVELKVSYTTPTENKPTEDKLKITVFKPQLEYTINLETFEKVIGQSSSTADSVYLLVKTNPQLR